MHHLLERQLKKLGNNTFLSSPESETFLKVVSDTYDNYDKDRKFLEHSFDISSNEFLELHNKVLKLLDELKIEKESIEQKVVERTQELKQKVEELNQSNRLLTKKEEELMLANNRLLALDKVKTEFISVAAHQLRTPLSGIKWTLNMFTGGEFGGLSDNQKVFILKIQEANDQMIHLVNDLLQSARLEAGTVEYTLDRVDFGRIVMNMAEDFRQEATQKNITLNAVVPSEKDLIVYGDAEKLRSVIQNLLENAIRYTPAGGRVSVTLSLSPHEEVTLAVTDTGIGIIESQKEKIFTRFFRGSNAIKIETEGSGLGLYIIKQIIERHGGSIRFESKENIGTTFTVLLPHAYVTPLAPA